MLSPDQASEVQRQALLATRRLAIQLAESEPPCLHLLEPHYPALLPSLCALVADTTGPTKAAAERTLARVFGLETVRGPHKSTSSHACVHITLLLP